MWGRLLRLFKVELERKTNLVALAAFLLALGSVVIQLGAYWRGPVVRMFPPDQVLIRAVEFAGGGRYVAVTARMAYVNTGSPGYNAVLEREAVRFRMGGREYLHLWHRFVSTDAGGGTLNRKDRGEAEPTPLMAGGAESHETEFTPRRQRCRHAKPDCDPNAHFLTWDEFRRRLAGQDTLELTFEARIYGGDRPVTAHCQVDVDPTLRIALVRRDWAGPSCWPD